MMRGRSLKKALKSNDLPAEFGAWTAIAKSRMQLRAVVHAKETRSSPPRYEAPPPHGYGHPPHPHGVFL
jgi:hypothetical protein